MHILHNHISLIKLEKEKHRKEKFSIKGRIYRKEGFVTGMWHVKQASE